MLRGIAAGADLSVAGVAVVVGPLFGAEFGSFASTDSLVVRSGSLAAGAGVFIPCIPTNFSIPVIFHSHPCRPVCIVSSMYLHLFKVNRNMDILSLLIVLCRACLVIKAMLLALRPELPPGLLLIV